jgi:diadenosine tetraphosphate (Ap4A) HIT family hydrolase
MDYLIAENKYYKIMHCNSCSIPGYLIVAPRITVRSISQLPKEYQHHLGPVFSLATTAIQQIIEPLQIYCIQFGEKGESLHYHIFPRTQIITDLYLKEFPEQKETINGPLLFAWARSYYSNGISEIWDDIRSIISDFRLLVIHYLDEFNGG